MKCDIRLADPMPYIVGPPQFRRVYLRGDLKMKDGKQGAKVDTHCIVFTDLFLVCKATTKRADRLRILKPPMHIARICLQQFSDHCTLSPAASPRFKTPLWVVEIDVVYQAQVETGFAVSAINDFGMPTSLYYFFTPSIEETRKWLEMTSMAHRDFYRLKSVEHLSIYVHLHLMPTDYFRPLNPQQCFIGPPFGITNGFTKLDMMLTLDHGRVPSSGFPGRIYSDHCSSVLSSDIVHRKSSSMDSQIVAEHSRLANMRKVNTISSADHLDRLCYEGRHASNLLSRQKLSVSNNATALMNSSLLGQSKSSVDLSVRGNTSRRECMQEEEKAGKASAARSVSF
uniref:PH domain-containing protein n=1 Tax=Parascaris equorum TaxID=6256 RepID=A0A914RBQ9_PAREQ